MGKCLKCGARTALAIGKIYEVTCDQEPYDSGVLKPPGGEDVMLAPGEEIVVGVHVCPECGWIEDIWIESPRDKADQTEIERLRGELRRVADWLDEGTCSCTVDEEDCDDYETHADGCEVFMAGSVRRAADDSG